MSELNLCGVTADDMTRISFRLLVPANSAGSIIGPKGETIKKMSSQHNAYLRVPEIPHASERLVLISCNLGKVPSIIKQLCRPIFKALREDNNIPEEHHSEILVLVDSQQAGYLVGRGGEKLKDLRLDTGCNRFKIYKDRLPYSEERVCEIQGGEDSVVMAAHLALEILAQHPVPHDHINYIPLPDAIMEMGDFGGYARFSMGQQDLRNRISSSNGDLRNSRLSIGSRHQDHTPHHHDQLPPSPRHGNVRRNTAVERDRSPLRGSGVKTKDIYIDDCYTRHVIGARGSQIEKIRSRSGASVQVADDETVQNNERKIVITGRQSDIDLALKLINEAIANRINIIQHDDQRNDDRMGDQFDYVNELFDRISLVVPFHDINNNDQSIIEEIISIADTDTSTVMGPRNGRINDMRHYTKCDIVVQNDNEVVHGLRRIRLRGTPRQVHRAIFMIRNITHVMR